MIIYFVSVSHGLASRLHCIKLEYSFRLKIKCNDWLLAAKQPSSQSLCFFLSLRLYSSSLTSRPGLNINN